MSDDHSATTPEEMQPRQAAPAEAPAPAMRTVVDEVFGYDFYISYAWRDGRRYGTALAKALTQQGFICFLDSKDFPVGANLPAATRRALQNSTQLLLIVTAGAHDSKYVVEEVKTFSKLRRPIVSIEIGLALRDARADSQLTRILDPAAFTIREEEERRLLGPTDQTINDIRRTFDLMRQTEKRIRAFSTAAVVFAIIAVLAVMFAVQANHQPRQPRIHSEFARSAPKFRHAGLF